MYILEISVFALLLLFILVVCANAKRINFASFTLTRWIKAEFKFDPIKDDKIHKMTPKEGNDQESNNGDHISITSKGDHNTIVGKLTVGQPPPKIAKEQTLELLNLLPNKKAFIHISAINGDNRSIMFGREIHNVLSSNGFNNLSGINTVFVPLIEGVEVIKKGESEYVVLVGVV